MKDAYEKPVILKHETGQMNKFGTGLLYRRNVREQIDGVSVEELVREYGSPLFVFSEKTLRRRLRQYQQAFSTNYPNVVFAWSYKTNYLSAICATLHQEGALAEVVCGMEYEKARKLGIPGDKIIFNGPNKGMAALRTAAQEGAMIHVDHLDEVADLEQVASEREEPLKIGIRLNMDTGIHPQWSRFGFNLDSGQALDAVKRIQASGRLTVSGLHCHIGTFILEPNAYAVAVEKLLRFAYELEDRFNSKIEYIDLGGGFPSRSRLKGIYLPPEIAVPPVEEYAEKITQAFYHHLRKNEFPRLVLETGRAIVDEAGFLVTSVVASKRLPDGRKAYVLDGGINLLYTSNWYKFTVETDTELTGASEPCVLYGPLCMNIDVVDEGTMLPPLRRGTRLILSPVGAYNVTQSMQFIEYRPNVVLVGEDGTVDVIREAEDLTDIERREKLPDRLKLPKT